jgi:polymorphic toxin system nucleotidyltransferase-like protein
MEPERLIAVVSGWAAERNEILAAALCGSHATGSARPDSDIDLVLVCTNPEGMLADVSWARDFGPVCSVAFESYGLVESVRVAYENGPEVEFGITTIAWATLPIDPGTARVMRDGLRILYDPSGRLAHAVRYAQSTQGG